MSYWDRFTPVFEFSYENIDKWKPEWRIDTTVQPTVTRTVTCNAYTRKDFDQLMSIVDSWNNIKHQPVTWDIIYDVPSVELSKLEELL